jgi:hypothetical protein
MGFLLIAAMRRKLGQELLRSGKARALPAAARINVA